MLKNIAKLGKELTRVDQKSILGGATFTCHCGFVGGPYESMTIQVSANSVSGALNSLNCGGTGATCRGNQN